MKLRNGVLHMKFFLQLATQRLLRCKLQEKLLRVTWPLDITITLVSPEIAYKLIEAGRYKDILEVQGLFTDGINNNEDTTQLIE